MNIPTVTENLNAAADGLSRLLEELLLKHTNVYRWNPPDSCIISLCNYGFQELSDAGRQLQARLIEDYRHFAALVSLLLKAQPAETLQALKQANDILKDTIELQHTWHASTQEVLDSALEALRTEMSLLNRLYDSSSGRVVVVPDTNAVLYHPQVESWSFTDVSEFTIALLPSVLSELDALKVGGELGTGN